MSSEPAQKIVDAIARLHQSTNATRDMIARVLHQHQVHEQRTEEQFRSVAEMFKGFNARLTVLETAREDTGNHRRPRRFYEWRYAAVEALIVVLGLGAIWLWAVR